MKMLEKISNNIEHIILIPIFIYNNEDDHDDGIIACIIRSKLRKNLQFLFRQIFKKTTS